MKHYSGTAIGLLLTGLAMIPTTSRADAEFTMPVMDVFSITGKGIVLTGRIESGSVTYGDVVCLVSQAGGDEREVTIAGIEQFRKLLESAGEGENVGLLLKDVEKGEVAPGDRLIGEC